MRLVYRSGGRVVIWLRPSALRVATDLLRRKLLGRPSRLLPSVPEGPRLHVGAGQTMLEGYENLDGYDNQHRPDFFQTPVKRFIRAEVLDKAFEDDTVAEIRSHHLFEHISILDVDRTLRGWNKIMKLGGLVWIQVPDFEGCVRQILRLKREEDKEIYYRHIWGSQMGPGEFHRNGFTAKRLIRVLAAYGFETRAAYVEWTTRTPVDPQLLYPSNCALPDLTVKAVKVGQPLPEVLHARWTQIAYRKSHPNPELDWS